MTRRLDEEPLMAVTNQAKTARLKIILEPGDLHCLSTSDQGYRVLLGGVMGNGKSPPASCSYDHETACINAVVVYMARLIDG